MIGLVILALGLPVYGLWSRAEKARELALLRLHGVGEDPLVGPLQPGLERARGLSRSPSSGRGPDVLEIGDSFYGYAAAARAPGAQGRGRSRPGRPRDRHVDGQPARARRGRRARRRGADRGADLHAAGRTPRAGCGSTCAASRGVPRRASASTRATSSGRSRPGRGSSCSPTSTIPRAPSRRPRTCAGSATPRARWARACWWTRCTSRRYAVLGRPWGSAARLGSEFVITIEPHQGVRPVRPALRLDRGRARPRAADVAAQRPVRRHPGASRRAPERRRARPARRASPSAPAASSRPTRKVSNAFLAARPELACEPVDGGMIAFPRLLTGDVESLCELLRERFETTVVPGRFFGARRPLPAGDRRRAGGDRRGAGAARAGPGRHLLIPGRPWYRLADGGYTRRPDV